MIDFKYGLHEVRIFSVSENGEQRNGLGDEGADGGQCLQNFWARTASGHVTGSRSSAYSREQPQRLQKLFKKVKIGEPQIPRVPFEFRRKAGEG